MQASQFNLQWTTAGKVIIWTFEGLDDACECWEHKGFWTTKEAALKAYLDMGYGAEYAENSIYPIEVSS